MSILTRNILDFYDFNEKNNWYLKKYYTDTKEVGLYQPHAKNVIYSKPNNHPYTGTIDEHNTYEINSLGLRGKVYEDSDIIASGCSITFGIGVPEEGRWTNFLGNLANKDVMNLGNPGGSVETICNNIIQYCMNSKMPKEVFCLFPDFFRSMVVVDREFYKSKIPDKRIEQKDILQLTFCNPKVQTYKKSVFMEIENKENIEDKTSPHQLILDSVNCIYNLESFCFTNNIKLYWTTWDISTTMIMQKLIMLKNFKLKNFVPFISTDQPKNLDYIIANQCILNHESEFKNSLFWHKGSDYSIVNYKKTSDRAHPGIHFHYHVAKFFYGLSLVK